MPLKQCRLRRCERHHMLRRDLAHLRVSMVKEVDELARIG